MATAIFLGLALAALLLMMLFIILSLRQKAKDRASGEQRATASADWKFFAIVAFVMAILFLSMAVMTFELKVIQ